MLSIHLSIIFLTILESCLIIIQSSSCWFPITSQYPSVVQPFLKAKPLTSLQQQQLLNVYASPLPQVKSLFKSNIIEIDYSYKIYINNIQQCNTQSTKLVTFNVLDDAWICFHSSFVPIACNQIWQLATNCGTYVQIHFPFDQQVLSSKQVPSNQNLNVPINLSMFNLCAGTYHIWLVYSTRIGRIIKSVKPLFISYPLCKC